MFSKLMQHVKTLKYPVRYTCLEPVSEKESQRVDRRLVREVMLAYLHNLFLYLHLSVAYLKAEGEW